MTKSNNKTSNPESNLYNKILLLSRNKLFYTKFCLNDTFQNRINLIFFHLSFIFVKIKQTKRELSSIDIHQKLFDLTFSKIELNMREVGYGDVATNKNMKFLVKSFYDILLFCENYNQKTLETKHSFFGKYLGIIATQKLANYDNLIDYFNEYQTFCFDLKANSVLKGDLDFKYNK